MCGGLQEKSKKMITIDEMYPIFKTAKDSKDTGGIHDFVEILKLYDKNEDKTILSKDLFRLLTNLGMLFLSSLYVMYLVRGCGRAEWGSSAHAMFWNDIVFKSGNRRRNIFLLAAWEIH